MKTYTCNITVRSDAAALAGAGWNPNPRRFEKVFTSEAESKEDFISIVEKEFNTYTDRVIDIRNIEAR